MTRSEIHDQFSRQFAEVAGLGVSIEALTATERTIGTSFPSSIREFLSKLGAVWCPEIERKFAERNANLWLPNHFLSPSEIVEATEIYHLAGMPEKFVCFSEDCMGNMFCFEKSGESDRDDAPVWFFDHDFCEMSHESESFDLWLKRYLDL